MRLIEIAIVKRNNGFFEFRGRKIEAVHPGNGYGVALVLKPSPVDGDFGVPVLFVSWEDLKAINEALDISDKETLKLRKGKGWNTGPRPYDKDGLKLGEFI